MKFSMILKKGNDMIIMELLTIKIEGEIILKILGTILEVARHLTVFLMKALVVVLEVEVSSVLSPSTYLAGMTIGFNQNLH